MLNPDNTCYVVFREITPASDTMRWSLIVVVKKTFRYPNVFFYKRNALFLQPLMPQSFIPEHFYGKGYNTVIIMPHSFDGSGQISLAVV
jgi:hypothetical protein